MRKIYKLNLLAGKNYIAKILTSFLLFLFFSFSSSAQCPENIDFEQGTFGSWRLFNATFISTGVLTNINPTAPVPGRHDMITPATLPALDQYGNFPKLCPNGSGRSIRMGLETTGTNADLATYTFSIPAGQDEFNLIYNYAIVINNSGGHPALIQPRLTISVKNLTDNTQDPCSSFDIAYANDNQLPGFKDYGPNPNIKYKPWAANSINLNGLAGKMIEISFTASGCGATGGTHFGYAYIDINSECSSSFIGATFCPDDAFINVTAPFGYQGYKWWNALDPTTIIGNAQTINFTPPPPPGTTLRVEVSPYTGYGCIDTLTAELQDTLTIQSIAGPDRISCDNAPVQLGAIPKPGYTYSWTPATGLSNPNISNPIATPAISTEYILTTMHEGGGCATKDTVWVYAAVLDNTIQLTGLNTYCLGDPQAAVLSVQPADSVQWYLNTIAIPGATQTTYSPVQSGTYHATVFSFVGCDKTSNDIVITVYDTPNSGFTTNELNQCFRNNQFVFTNTSTVASGTLTYNWDLGDGNTPTSQDVTHSYTLPGTYLVRMIPSTVNGCKDTSYVTVQVYDQPVAGFNVNAPSQCFKDNQFVFTNTSTIAAGTMQYAWDLGDGNTATTTDVTHSYTLPGTYHVKLLVTSGYTCVDEKTFEVIVYPTPAASFVLNNAVQQCFKDNQFSFTNTSTVYSGNLMHYWDMGNGYTFTSQDITYSYPVPGTYSVKLVVTGDGGCKDSSIFNVTVYPTPIAGFSVNQGNQCFNNNQFVFTNTSTVYSGGLQYAWDLGDGTTSTATDITHSYTAYGVHYVRLIVTGTNGGCIDSMAINTEVFKYPVTDFLIQPLTCTNLPVYLVNKTVNTTSTALDYLWDFGNGHTSTLQTPVYAYPAAGNYKIKLTTNISGCPNPVSIRELDIRIDEPLPGISYPEFDARYNFPEVLNARNVGTGAIWSPATFLDNKFSYKPTFKGLSSQLYTIQLKNGANGCVTVDSLYVKVLKKIEIYVPTVFTPTGDGVNDLLRPLLFGFDHVVSFRIYNRWGKMLFQMKSDRPGWDGKLNGHEVEMQTVVWMIEAIDVDGVLHKQQGTTVLMR